MDLAPCRDPKINPETFEAPAQLIGAWSRRSERPNSLPTAMGIEAGVRIQLGAR